MMSFWTNGEHGLGERTTGWVSGHWKTVPKVPVKAGGDPEWVAQHLGPVLSYTVIKGLKEDTKGRLTWTWKGESMVDDKNPEF